MKIIIRILMVALFASIVFIPNVYTSRLTLIPMFLLMIVLVVLYWFSMFWVSRKDVKKVLKTEPESDFFVGKIPSDPQADLTRGRLCAIGGKLVLMQRSEKNRKTEPCTKVWEIEINNINAVGFGRVLSARTGFILYTKDNDEIRFTYSKATKNKSMIYKALGWEEPKV